MKTLGVALSFVQRSVHSAEKLLDITDDILDAGKVYSNEIKLDAEFSAKMSQHERSKEEADYLKLLSPSKK